MCADTRLSRYQTTNGMEKTIAVHDNLQKLIVVNKPFIAIGCVGSPELASYIIKKIQTEFSSALFANQLKKIISNNKDDVIRWVGEFITANSVPYKYAKCVLVIGGQNPSHKRVVSAKRIIELARVDQQTSKDKIDKLFDGKKIENFSREDFSKFFRESTASKMNMKDILFQGMFNKKNETGTVELDIPGQTLFALEIRADNFNTKEEILTIKNYQWGETAVYGGGLGKQILTPDFFGHLDLREGSGNFKTDIIPFAATIRDNFGDTIGGGMTNIILINGEILTMVDKLIRINPETMESELIYHTETVAGELRHHINGKQQRLINFNERQNEGTMSHLLCMSTR